MLIIPVIRRAINHLRRPFIQRLISLVVSTLLAMSLVYTTTVLALPPLEQKVASHVSSQSVLPANRIESFMPKTDIHGQQATEKHAREGGLV